MRHLVNQESLTLLFDKLSLKTQKEYHGQHVGPGWLKYDFGDAVWDLNDGRSLCSSENYLIKYLSPQIRIILSFRGDSNHT